MLQPQIIMLLLASALLTLNAEILTDPSDNSFETKLSQVKIELSDVKDEIKHLKELLQWQTSMILDMQHHNSEFNKDTRAWQGSSSAPPTVGPTTLTPGPDIESRIQKLEDLARVGTLRSCSEYAAYGIKTSGEYMVDPDGPLSGVPPINVFCQFDGQGGATTEIHHNSENQLKISHCHDPACYSRNITYTSGVDGEPIPLSQIEALISLSENCEQSFSYSCTLAPLRNGDVDYAYWLGRDNSANVYFTGNTSVHACDCFYSEEGCLEQEVLENTCNCDANLPIPTSDTGLLNNKEALPMMAVYFGGLNYDIQTGSYQIGRLACRGDRTFKTGTSCTSLKLAGESKSGYYTVKKEGSIHTNTVFCNMEEGGYDNVPETTELSTDSPLGTISAWIPRINQTGNKQDLPDGWLPCDGSKITKGIWAGGNTPDLNSGGHFLRGGSEDDALEKQEDQLQDHQHVDAGHTHSNDPHSHSYYDTYSLDQTGKSGKGSDYFQRDDASSTRTSDSTKIIIASSTSNISGVTSGFRSGAETRPRNMKVVWAIKVW